MNRIIVAAILGMTLSCTHQAPAPQANNHGGHEHGQPRGVADVKDTAVPHEHGGRYSLNPETNEYEYTPNKEDIIARHSFVMLGADRTLGYHISFFESRHQHQVIIRMKFLAEDPNGDIPFDTSIFAPPTKIGKTTGFISATVAAGDNNSTSFPLYTIGNGTTRAFPVTFFDGIIGSDKPRPVENTVFLKVEKIYHFNRMFVKDEAESTQYMAFKSDPKKPNEYIMAHIIQGLGGNVKASNYEHLVRVTLDKSVDIPDGSIIAIDADDAVPLKKAQKVAGSYLRKGLDEKTALDSTAINFTVADVIHNRPVPIDPTQAGAKKALGIK